MVPAFSPSSGGEYQYSLSIITTLARAEFALRNWEFTLFARAQDERHLQQLALNSSWNIVPLRPNRRERVLDRIKMFVRNSSFGHLAERILPRTTIDPAIGHLDPNLVLARADYRAYFTRKQIDWLMYTTPNALSFEAGLPFIMPIHDLQHRLQPQFPEVSAGGEWERREYIFRNASRKALAILVDSETGKEDALACYGNEGLAEDRVEVLPFLPAVYIPQNVSAGLRAVVRGIYRIPSRYFFYPAQFWPHKNHRRLIEAIGLLSSRGIVLDLVLSGNVTGPERARTYQEMMRVANRLGIAERIHCLGYVPNEHMAALYSEARALLFPTFFGPTNIPILEAWATGCPVLTSDLRGIREQVGDAGLLVVPDDIESLADGVARLWQDDALCAELARRGFMRLSSYGPSDFASRLLGILERVQTRMSS